MNDLLIGICAGVLFTIFWYSIVMFVALDAQKRKVSKQQKKYIRHWLGVSFNLSLEGLEYYSEELIRGLEE
ncbi:MAG: hypothetical protein ACW990_00245 [Promethearchaeota archaeon]|jgi:hypothetical protein